MKRLFPILLLLCLGAWTPLGAARARLAAAQIDPGDAAIEAYRRGDCAEAERRWTAELAGELSDERRGALLYNLGNASYRQGELLRAVAWYTAALGYLPRDADLWTNLELSRRQAGLEAADRGDLPSALWRLSISLTPAESARTAFWGVALFALALLYEALRGGRLARWLSVLALLVLLVAWAPLCAHALRPKGFDTYVVARGGAQVRSEPREDLQRIARLEPATRLRWIDALPGWVRVEGADGARGWISAEDVLRTGE